MKTYELNDYQNKILNAERFYEAGALANIGGMLFFDAEITADEVELLIKGVLSYCPELKFRLNSDKELYECDDNDFTIERVRVQGEAQEVNKFLTEDFRVPFDLYDSRLYDFKIIEADDGIYAYIKVHHILADSAAVQLFIKKMTDCRKVISSGKKYCADITPTVYPVMTKLQKESAKKYFSEKLEGFEAFRFVEREGRSAEADYLCFTAPLYKTNMTTEFVASVYSYFSYALETSGFSLGFVLGNRRKDEKEMFGMFANTLPLIINYSGDSFSELRKSIKADIFKLLKYSSYTSDELMRISPYEVSLSYRTGEFAPSSELGSVNEFFNGFLDDPLRIDVVEGKDNLEIKIYYRTELFERSMVKNMGEGILRILDQEMNGCEAIHELKVLTDFDEKVYGVLNNTDALHEYKDVIDCFIDHISETDSLIWDNHSLSGEELFGKSVAVAEYLNENAAETSRVGICLERSPEMIFSVLGCLMAGKTFLIISDSIPRAENFVEFILNKDVMKSIGDGSGFDDATDYYRRKMYSFNPKDTAYMIFTSGSTGAAKCIEISREALMSRLEWQHKTYGLNGRILQKTVNTFDVSVWEMLSVVYGAKLVLLPPGDEIYPDKIYDALVKYEIEKVHFVPTMLNLFLEYVQRNSLKLPGLKEVYVSGEKLETPVGDKFFDVLPHVKLINLYGPAECTIDVLHYECVKGKEISIGHPVDNTKVHIVDSKGNIKPVGFTGEIKISGQLVGKGYLVEKDGKIEKSDFGPEGYATGDIGKLGFDGNVYIYGRKDNQIKLHGKRLNISDIKYIILNSEGVEAAELIYENDLLECFLVGNTDINRLKKRIAEEVSAYAVPHIFKYVDTIPQNTNQKTDREKLLHMPYKIAGVKKADDNKESLPKGICKILLEEVSKYIWVGIDDNLFECGMDSITVIKITAALQKRGLDISYGDFYENLTIREIAGNISNRRYYTYIRKKNSERVLICFPFAGGEPQDYLQMSEKLNMDVIGIYISSFSPESSIISIAEKLSEILPINNYKEINVLGQCVGSALAMEFVSGINLPVRKLMLLAPSVKTMSGNLISTLSPWRVLGDKTIEGLLHKAGSNYKYTPETMKRFRIDTDRFFRYRPDTGLRDRLMKKHPETKVYVTYGEKDLFTINKRKITAQIQKITGRHIKVRNIKGAGHFLNTN